MIKRFITVKFMKEGVHAFKEAGTNPKLATGKWDDVSFLQHDHMHYFYFVVSIEVFENDRELEFIQVSRWLQRYYADNTLKLNNSSCESIAEDLISYIRTKYLNREITVEIYEDNINGCKLEYAPDGYEIEE